MPWVEQIKIDSCCFSSFHHIKHDSTCTLKVIESCNQTSKIFKKLFQNTYAYSLTQKGILMLLSPQWTNKHIRFDLKL